MKILIDLKLTIAEVALLFDKSVEELKSLSDLLHPSFPEDMELTLSSVLQISGNLIGPAFEKQKTLLLGIQNGSTEALGELKEIIEEKKAAAQQSSGQQTFGSVLRKIVSAGKPPKK